MKEISNKFRGFILTNEIDCLYTLSQKTHLTNSWPPLQNDAIGILMFGLPFYWINIEFK